MQFLLNVLAVMLGLLLGIILIGVLLFWIGSRIFRSIRGRYVPKIKEDSILKLSFSGLIPEQTNNQRQQPSLTGLSASNLRGFFQRNLGLVDWLQLLDQAGKDDRIKGIYLELSSLSAGRATLKSLRDALAKFKATGKFIVAHSARYSQNEYYLASVANEIYLHPRGSLDFRGLAVEVYYYTSVLEKLGVEAQVFYAGDFKSAAEPFFRKDMSDYNREQLTILLKDMYNFILKDIEKDRKLSIEQLKELADNYEIQNAQDAHTHQLVDGLYYKDQVIDKIKTRLKVKPEDQLTVQLPTTYWEQRLTEYKKENRKEEKAKKKAKEEIAKIALLFAEGMIVDGKGQTGNIGGDRYAAMIRKIRNTKNIKAIVLRIDSGGGSALASDTIWRELMRAREQGIYIVASIANTAASGGYYIACAADKILAQPISITGSIGVFGVVPNVHKLVSEKIGISTDAVRTGAAAGSNQGIVTPMTDKQRAIIQKSIAETYTTFKQRVAEARNMDMERVEAIARGRVWTGNQALEEGLIDGFGQLEDAVNMVLKHLEKDKKEVHFKRFPNVDMRSRMLSDENETLNPVLRTILNAQHPIELVDLARDLAQDYEGIQMRVPFELRFNR